MQPVMFQGERATKDIESIVSKLTATATSNAADLLAPYASMPVPDIPVIERLDPPKKTQPVLNLQDVFKDVGEGIFLFIDF